MVKKLQNVRQPPPGQRNKEEVARSRSRNTLIALQQQQHQARLVLVSKLTLLMLVWAMPQYFNSNKDNDVDRTLSIACLFKILTSRKVEKPFLLVSSAFHALNPSVTSAQAVQFSLQCKHCKSDSRSLNIFSFLKWRTLKPGDHRTQAYFV